MKVTIFGLEGTGTSSAGKRLAKEMNWEFKSSGNMMREMAEKEGITLEQFNTRRIEIMKETGDDSSDREIDDHIKEYGEMNNSFVFESRLAWFLIPDSFKIKLVCSDEVRSSRVASRDGVSLKEAHENNIRRQKENKEAYEMMYKKIVYPPEDSVFDLIIDTGEKDLEEVVEEIINKVK